MSFKATLDWKKVTEQIPEPDRDYLVWTGSFMVVGTPHIYDEEFLANIPENLKEDFRKAKGKFVGDMGKFYFDDEKVYYSELPLAPGEKEPELPDPFEGMISKDAYFKKDGSIIGIHAIGHPGPHEYDLHGLDGSVTKIKTDFMQMEIWGNEYDDEHNMQGRGSFRVFNEFNIVVKDLIEEGWVQYEGPKKKEKI